MKRQTMFLRMVTASLTRRRSRMLVALLAIAVGATILSGMVTIYYDVPRQMGAQFRSYGANMILTATGEGEFTTSQVEAAAALIPSGELVGMAPYRYESVMINDKPTIAAGTDMAGAKSTSPYWLVNGEWPRQAGEVLMGKKAAATFRLKVGDEVELHFTEEGAAEDAEPRVLTCTVTGILDTGGAEEEYVYLSLQDLENLTGKAASLAVAELSVSADQTKLTGYAETINAAVPGAQARLVKRVTQSEATVLGKLQSLVLLVTVIVLLLTMICVTTTMMAVVTERRKEIGLRKALGASDGSIIAEFMSEGLLLGGFGGLLGCGLGFAFAQAVSVNVFNSSITFQWVLLPVTVVVSILVTGLACIAPVRSATDVDPALVLKGE